MIQGTCTDLFHHDTTVILTESTASGNPTFQNWTGCDPVSPDGTTCLLVIRSANRTVDAFFN
jgi:hypothetical protein